MTTRPLTRIVPLPKPVKPLTPSQWNVLRLVFFVDKPDEPFETWDLVHALRKQPEFPALHYKTIATHLDALVEKGYLHRDPGTGGHPRKRRRLQDEAGAEETEATGDQTDEHRLPSRHLYILAAPRAKIAAAYVDRLLNQLGDDPELLELVERQARRRRGRARKPRRRR